MQGNRCSAESSYGNLGTWAGRISRGQWVGGRVGGLASTCASLSGHLDSPITENACTDRKRGSNDEKESNRKQAGTHGRGGVCKGDGQEAGLGALANTCQVGPGISTRHSSRRLNKSTPGKNLRKGRQVESMRRLMAWAGGESLKRGCTPVLPMSGRIAWRPGAV